MYRARIRKCLKSKENNEVVTVFHKSLKTEINLNYIVQRSSPYRAVNTLHLGYKNQSVNAV